MGKKSDSVHTIVRYGAIVPAGWVATVPNQSLTLPLQETFDNKECSAAAAAPTNAAYGFWSKGPITFVASKEEWRDSSKGGGTFVLTDPKASQVSSVALNQSAIGGSHNFGVGDVSSTISSNAVATISAGGTAIGNIISAAAGKP